MLLYLTDILVLVEVCSCRVKGKKSLQVCKAYDIRFSVATLIAPGLDEVSMIRIFIITDEKQE